MGKQEIGHEKAPARQDGLRYADSFHQGGGSDLHNDTDGLEGEEHKGAGYWMRRAEDGVAATGVEEAGESERSSELDGLGGEAVAVEIEGGN